MLGREILGYRGCWLGRCWRWGGLGRGEVEGRGRGGADEWRRECGWGEEPDADEEGTGD